MTSRKIETGMVVLLAIVAAAIRMVEHWPNVTPVAATALMAGSYLGLPWGLLLPGLVMVVSDTVIGFSSWPITAAVYGSFGATVWLGRGLLQQRTAWRVIEASLLASVLFYLVTNAAVWAFSGMYPLTAEGLRMSYWWGIPFFRNTLLGDLIFTGGFFLAARMAVAAARALFAVEGEQYVGDVDSGRAGVETSP